MDATSADTRGWAKVKDAAKYAGVSERTLREWLKDGLRHTRLPSGTILIPYSWIDQYLMGFQVSRNQVYEIVDEVMQEFKL